MKNIAIPILGFFALFSTSISAQDNQWSSGRPDGHAPINVMGDHYHRQGDVMLSYRYMPMWMKGNLSEGADIKNESILQNFMVAPIEMQMSMHMLSMMYAISDHVTLMTMGNYLSSSMSLETRMGHQFTTASGGVGDVSIAALIKLLNKNRQSLHLNAGLSIPTGDFDQRDATPMAENAPLAYPMQLGSGTWDPVIGVTYLGQSDHLSWGMQSKLLWRISENTEGYALGNNWETVGWGAVKVCDWLSFSTSLNYWVRGTIRGSDPDLNPMMMPLFDATNSGRQQLDFGIGSNFYVPSGSMKNIRIGIEMKIPVYQHVVGIQMKNTTVATLGIQYSI